MSAPDWPAVSPGVRSFIARSEGWTPGMIHNVITPVLRWAVVHGPALEAAEEVWWCEEHRSSVALSGTSNPGRTVRCLWWSIDHLDDTPCRPVKRPLLPKIEERK